MHMRTGKWALVIVVIALSIATASVIFLTTGNSNSQGENKTSWTDIEKQTTRNYTINVTDSVTIEHE
jgi:hypothetical protein